MSDGSNRAPGPPSAGPPQTLPSSLSHGGGGQLSSATTSVSHLKAQLKLVTQERDNLKQHMQQLGSTPGPKMDSPQGVSGSYPHRSHPNYISNTLDVRHHRTNSDSAQQASSKKTMSPPSLGVPGHAPTLSRSHSISASGDKSLMVFSLTSSPGATGSGSSGKSLPLVPAYSQQLSPGADINSSLDSRLMHELQITRKKLTDAHKKLEQTHKDADFYHRESETLRARYNDVVLEKQRCQQENESLRIYMEEERKEVTDLRRQQQEMLDSEGASGATGESLSIMYGNLLRNYEDLKEELNVTRKRSDDLANSHSVALAKLEQSQGDGRRFKTLYTEVHAERNQLKSQHAEVIKEWDRAHRERNDYKDSFEKANRKQEELTKELESAMAVRVKASKDIKRLTEERNAAMQEYSLIMSERDTVHKEIEKLHEEVNSTKKKMAGMDSKLKTQDDERRKLNCQVEMLKREIEQSLFDRDKALREAHELREKLGGGGKITSEYGDMSKHSSKTGRFDSDKHNKDRDSASNETLGDLPHGSGSSLLLEARTHDLAYAGYHREHAAKKDARSENLESANSEIEQLHKTVEKLRGELQDASLEADVAKGRRDWAFTERDKIVLERESIRTLCDKLRRERDRAVSELAEALRDSDFAKKQCIEVNKENKELRERLEALEKDVRLKSLQRSPGHSHSHDSAIDSDLQEWETENIDINMDGLSSSEDLGLDLSGGRDDIHCPLRGDKPIYISSIGKGSFLSGKLKVNDCILRVNDLDCRDVERRVVLETLRNADSSAAVSLVVRRKKIGRRYQAVLHLQGAKSSGLTLDLGVYVARIAPGSVAAKEGSIAVGDRILHINDHSLDHVDYLGEAVNLLNSGEDPLVITLSKSTHTLSSTGGPLSSSSSGHNLMYQPQASDHIKMMYNHESDHRPRSSGHTSSPNKSSSTTSPIKESVIRGSQELMKKLISGGGGGNHSSNSDHAAYSERVYSVSKQQHQQTAYSSMDEETYARHKNSHQSQTAALSAFGLMETVKEKVKGRKKASKEQHGSRDHSSHPTASSYRGKGTEDMVLAELDSVIDSHQSSSGAVGGREVTQQQASDSHPSSANSSARANPNSSGSSSGKSSAGKKKRSKEHNSSFRSGGTWPRTRGGPIIEEGTGTILHPQKMKKGRLPLAELLNNLPKYPPEASSSTNGKKSEPKPHAESAAQSAQPQQPVTYRHDHDYRSNKKSTRPLTAYDLLESYSIKGSEGERDFVLPPPPPAPASVDIGPKPVYSSAFTPSDNSIDESVKSGHAGKEVLDRYLRKSSSTNIVHLPLSTSTSPTRNKEPHHLRSQASMSPTPPPQGSAGALTSPLLSSPPPPMTSLSSHQTAYAALKAAHDLKHSGSSAVGLDPSIYGAHPVRGGPAFTPYYSSSGYAPTPHSSHLQHTSSPRYATSPPPLIPNVSSADSLMLGSPIPVEGRGASAYYNQHHYTPSSSYDHPSPYLQSTSPTYHQQYQPGAGYSHRSSTVDPYASVTHGAPKHPSRSTSVGPPSSGHQVYSTNPPYVPPHYQPSGSSQYHGVSMGASGGQSSGAPSPYGFSQQDASSPPPHYSEHGTSSRRAREGSYGYPSRVRDDSAQKSQSASQNEKSGTFPRKRAEKKSSKNSPTISGTLPNSVNAKSHENKSRPRANRSAGGGSSSQNRKSCHSLGVQTKNLSGSSGTDGKDKSNSSRKSLSKRNRNARSSRENLLEQQRNNHRSRRLCSSSNTSSEDNDYDTIIMLSDSHRTPKSRSRRNSRDYSMENQRLSLASSSTGRRHHHRDRSADRLLGDDRDMIDWQMKPVSTTLPRNVHLATSRYKNDERASRYKPKREASRRRAIQPDDDYEKRHNKPRARDQVPKYTEEKPKKLNVSRDLGRHCEQSSKEMKVQTDTCKSGTYHHVGYAQLQSGESQTGQSQKDKCNNSKIAQSKLLDFSPYNDHDLITRDPRESPKVKISSQSPLHTSATCEDIPSENDNSRGSRSGDKASKRSKTRGTNTELEKANSLESPRINNQTALYQHKYLRHAKDQEGHSEHKELQYTSISSRGRASYREELDFTSSRKKSETAKKNLIDELKEHQPLIQDRIIMSREVIKGQENTDPKQSADPLRSSRMRVKRGLEGLTPKNKELSKSQGDSLDDPSNYQDSTRSRGSGGASSSKSSKSGSSLASEYPTVFRKKSGGAVYEQYPAKTSKTKPQEKSANLDDHSRRRKSMPEHKHLDTSSITQPSENDYDEVLAKDLPQSAGYAGHSNSSSQQFFLSDSATSSKGEMGDGLSSITILNKSLESVITEESSNLGEGSKSGDDPVVMLPPPPLAGLGQEITFTPNRHSTMIDPPELFNTQAGDENHCLHNKPLPSPPPPPLPLPEHVESQNKDRSYQSEGIYEKAYFTDEGQRFTTPPQSRSLTSRSQAARNKRLRNRSLEMVLDEHSSPSPTRTR